MNATREFRLRDPSATWRHLATGAVFVGTDRVSFFDAEVERAVKAGALIEVIKPAKKNGRKSAPDN